MSPISALYNTLPTLEEAGERLTDRDSTLAAISELLIPYATKFGVCLVHSHCTLAEDETMLAIGNITKPVLKSVLKQPIYPTNWLATGEAYEYSIEHTEAPPRELFDRFQALTGSDGVLGLYYAGGDRERVGLEHTEGRRNVTSYPDSAADLEGETLIETAWIAELGMGSRSRPKVTMKCVQFCVQRDPRSPHTGKKTHARQ